MTAPEILFAHAYFVASDPRPLELMHPMPPLQPAELAAWIAREAGATVRLWDSTFRLGPQEFEVEASRLRPRIVWVYCHPTTRDGTQSIIRIARRSGAVVLAGGPDASLHPERYLRTGADAVLPGECEDALLEAVRALRAAHHRSSAELLSRIPGIVYQSGEWVGRSGGRPRTVPLESLPYPLRPQEQTRIHLERWRSRRQFRPMAISSARGCPVDCGFCTRTVFGRPHRRREPAAVVAEMAELTERFDVDRFLFADELFLADQHWLREFAGELHDRKLGVTFEGRASPRTTDPATVRKLAAVGLVGLDLDTASGSHELLDRLEWSHRPADVFRAAQTIRDAGVGLKLHVLVGLPGESRRDLDASMELVRTVEPDGVEVTRVDPGSPALFRSDWERVVAGRVTERPGRYLPAPVQDAAVAWMHSVGTRARPLLSQQARDVRASVSRPLLRAAVRLLPGFPRRG